MGLRLGGWLTRPFSGRAEARIPSAPEQGQTAAKDSDQAEAGVKGSAQSQMTVQAAGGASAQAAITQQRLEGSVDVRVRPEAPQQATYDMVAKMQAAMKAGGGKVSASSGAERSALVDVQGHYASTTTVDALGQSFAGVGIVGEGAAPRPAPATATAAAPARAAPAAPEVIAFSPPPPEPPPARAPALPIPAQPVEAPSPLNTGIAATKLPPGALESAGTPIYDALLAERAKPKPAPKASATPTPPAAPAPREAPAEMVAPPAAKLAKPAKPPSPKAEPAPWVIVDKRVSAQAAAPVKPAEPAKPVEPAAAQSGPGPQAAPIGAKASAMVLAKNAQTAFLKAMNDLGVRGQALWQAVRASPTYQQLEKYFTVTLPAAMDRWLKP